MAKLTDLTGSSINADGEEIRIREVGEINYYQIRQVSDPAGTIDTTSEHYDPYFTHTIYMIDEG